MKGRVTLVVLGAAALYAWAAAGVGLGPRAVAEGVPAFLRLARELFPPNWALLPRLVAPLVETIQMAIVGTALGALWAVPLILLGARNLAPSPPAYYSARAVMNLLRTIPDLLYAAVLVAVVGIGPFAGVLALGLFSLSIISKLTSESLEAIDPGPLEALRAAGADWVKTVRFAAVPQILPAYLGHVLYVFEINVRVSFVLGLVGAGGIGQTLLTALNLFRYPSATTIILVTLACVVAIDYASVRVRERLV